MTQPMLSCARTLGPCSARPAPAGRPCPPPPPPKPFPWIYVYTVGAALGFLGLLYKYYLYKLEQDKLGEHKAVWRPRLRVKRPLHASDLPKCVQYLIVGTGAAAWAAYHSIMEHDEKAKVFFVTKEDTLPYERPPMSKHMWFNANPPDIRHLNYVEDMKRKTMYLANCKYFMDPVKFYRKATGPAVSLASGWCVLRIDADEHIAWIKTNCGEQPMYYERCLLAVGSKPKTMSIMKTAPKAVRSRMTTFRTVRDLEAAYRKVREAKNVVIIGGGFLGAELSWHMSRMHKEWHPPPERDFEPVKIVHLMKDAGILASVLPGYLAEWASERLKCDNVTVMPNTQVYDAYESEDGKLKLTLSNGSSIVTDYAFVCVGNTPREELAEPSFLERDPVNGGFLVNTELEARKHLYVAGDAASFYSQWKNQRMRFEHYANAEEQGAIAGANMTGYWTPCNMEPHFRFSLGKVLDMEVVGEVGACMSTIAMYKPCEEDADAARFEMQRGEYGKPCYKQSNEYKNRYKRGILFYVRDETVVGVCFWNMPPIEDRVAVTTEILRAHPSYQDVSLLAELLGFESTECTVIPEAEKPIPPPCITRYRQY